MTGETEFIASLRGIARHPAARMLQDDCAVLELGRETLVLTHDMLVEGTHYLAGMDMADVAWKLVATNLSDLAAKGAEPLGVLVGHMLGTDDARFVVGLEEVLAHYGVPLLGGDTVAGAGPRVHGLTAIGRATHTPVPARSGARPDDTLYLSSAVGEAMLGFEALRDGTNVDSIAYRRPRAQLAQGFHLAPLVTSMMDVSDGLLLDASRLADASSVTIDIVRSAVPIATPESRRDDALRWGDDYALLFTAPPGIELPVAATAIGQVLARGEAPLMIDSIAPTKGHKLGYQH